MLALALALVLSTPPATRLQYERKCLHCHSEELAEKPRLTEAQWRTVIARERKRAPVLISKGDVPALARYLTQVLKRTPKKPKPVPAPITPSPLEPAVVATPEPLPPIPEPEPEVEPEPSPNDVTIPPPAPIPEAPPAPELSAELLALEVEGFDRMQARCSKCHTLGRVYQKLDSLETALTTLTRMRLKTGSGISRADARLLEAYLRAQLDDDDDARARR